MKEYVRNRKAANPRQASRWSAIGDGSGPLHAVADSSQYRVYSLYALNGKVRRAKCGLNVNSRRMNLDSEPAEILHN